MVVVRAHHFAPADEDWRARVLAAAERAARAGAPGSLAAVLEARRSPTATSAILLPTDEDEALRRVAAGIARELRASVHGFTFAVGHSRVATDPVDLYRAGNEALLAANVATAGDDASVLAFEDTGAYRLLLPAMSEDPAELQRFYAETVAPLVAYDDQYETDLVQTLETFLDADGNVAGTAARLYTHRHTVRYRLERVRDLTGLDVASTDGREKLGLGLKAMRVLGIAAPERPRDGGGRRRRPRPSRGEGPLGGTARRWCGGRRRATRQSPRGCGGRRRGWARSPRRRGWSCARPAAPGARRVARTRPCRPGAA